MTLTLTLVLGACSDAGLTVHNTEPAASITSPGNGREWAADQPLQLTASVHDAETDFRGLDYYLSDPELGDLTAELAFFDPDGVTLTVAEGVPSGDRTLTLKVVDPGGKSGTDTVDLAVIHDEAPAVIFQWPTDGDRVAADTVFDAAVMTSDPDEANLADLTLTWGDAAADAPDAPEHPESSGIAVVQVSAIAALGPAILSVTVTDSMGAVGSATVEFDVVDGDRDDDGFADELLGGDDCDDDDPAINPDADEICDGLDNDCDGLIDEDPVDGQDFYADADLDTWGDDATVINACEGAEGAADRGGDCDDSDSAVNPGALEICNDGLDNDCDGDWSECVWSGQNIHCDVGSARVTSDISYDVLPTAMGGMDLDGDGVGDLLATANRGSGGTYRSVNAYPGPISGPMTNSDVAFQLVGNYAADWTRGALLDAGDFNGDGASDLVIGEPEGGTSGAGGVYLIHGPVGGSLDLASDADGAIASDNWNADVGTAVVAADLDGDGWPDLAIGAPGEETDTYQGGRTYLFTRSTIGSVSLSSYDHVIEGHSNAGLSAQTLAAPGDLDGDGYTELAVGVPGDDGASNRAGAVYLVRGGPDLGTMDLEDGWAVLQGADQAGRAGTSIAAAGDLDGDGKGDLLIGAPDADHAGMNENGTVSIVLGDSSLAGVSSLSAAYATLYGQDSYEGLGENLAAGDWDHDGLSDVLLGSEDAQDTYGDAVGAGYLFYGSLATGDIDASTADAIFRGDEEWHQFARLVGNLGDVSGDGVDDLALGAPYSSEGGASSGGELCVFFGAGY